MRAFREILAKSKNIVVLTGSGVSAESGMPTFRYRGADGLWKKRTVKELATPDNFRNNPSLVWEFYDHRRKVATTKLTRCFFKKRDDTKIVILQVPNAAHKALAELEAKLDQQQRSLTVITQNTDMLHHRAGSRNVLEMFGNVFKTRCTGCGHLSNNHDIPIVPSLQDRGCEQCHGLLRPDVVWYGEGMDFDLLSKVDYALRHCDLYILVGSSSQIYPAANYGPMLVDRGVPVAEFNLNTTPVSEKFNFHFPGNCGETLPEALL